MRKLVDWFRRKVLRRYDWSVIEPEGKRPKRIRVDALPIEQFRVQREQAAARLRSMHEAS